jgi:starch synthase
MDFHQLAPEVKERQITRIMRQGAATFNHEVHARQYIELYEKMLERPLIR